MLAEHAEGIGRIALPRGFRFRPRVPRMLLLPAGLVGAALALPIVYLVIRSASAGPDALGQLLQPRTLAALVRTIALAAGVTASSIAIGVPLAWLTMRTDLRFRRFWTVVAALPLAVPSYVAGFAILTFLGPRGLLQSALDALLGASRLPDIAGFPGAVLALTIVSYPYVYISVATAFARMDPSLEDASRSLGAGPVRTFFRVTLPQLRPAIAAGSLLTGLYCLSDFGAVSLMRFGSFTQAIFVQYQSSFDRSLAAMLGLTLVVLTGTILWFEFVARGRTRYHRSASGSARRPRRVRLGLWRTPATLVPAAVAAATLGMPTGVAVYWSVLGAQSSRGLEGVAHAAFNSLLASALAAAVVVLAALPVAVLVARYRGGASRVVEGLTYSSLALPGIVLALSLVFFAANFARPLYQTFALLLFAYAVRFLPQAVGTLRSSIIQVNPRLEETARSLGRGGVGALASVTLPLVRPGILAGAGLVFLTTMKELPATLLLGPNGFQTLATRIWSAAEGGFFGQAGIPALVLIAVASLPMVFLLPRLESRL